jgi:hypothetical protein
MCGAKMQANSRLSPETNSDQEVVQKKILKRINYPVSFIRHEPNRKLRLKHSFCSCTRIRYFGNIFIAPLPINDRDTHTRICFSFPTLFAICTNTFSKCCKACRRVFTSTLLYLIGSQSSCDLGSETYKLNLEKYIYNYSIYILNLVGRSIGKFFRNRLASGGSCRFKISSFGCTLRRLL